MATLIIWNNHMYVGSSYPGHAALSITDNWAKNGQATDYVSWWPDDGQKWKPRAAPQLNISQDLALEGYAPDHILHIPGLLVGRMMSKWASITTNPEKVYRFYRQNCSTIVAQVLKEGSQLGSAMQRNNLIWTPLKCLRLGLAMGGVEMRWDKFLDQLSKSGYLTRSDVAVLNNLLKRDAKHGKNATGNSYYYAHGKKVNEKPILQWQGYQAGKFRAGATLFESCEGSLLSISRIDSITDEGATATPIIDGKKI